MTQMNDTVNDTSTPIIIQQGWRDSVHIKIRVGDGNQQYWLRFNLKHETEKQEIREWNKRYETLALKL